MSVFDTPANRAALARGRGAIAEHDRVFSAFETAAVSARDPLEAAALAQVAYSWANRKHPGRLASPPLERLLTALGREHVAAGHRSAPPAGDERVLHVATQVYDTGGHTRVLERWLQLDGGRRSTVLLLRQDDPLPASLVAVASAAAAPVVRLAVGDLFDRARHLRALAAQHDLVVMHVSPFEVVVALAFADPMGRPPTILFNHASHHLWAGVAATDVVASLWEPDARDAVARRGFSEERSLVLPLPAAARELPDARAARAALGLPPDAPVLLTAAAPYKLAPVLEPRFGELAERLLAALPDATLLVAGPRPGDGVAPVHERARVLGPVADLAPLLAAADLVLDSWPASGATMVLDAAAAGVPVLSLGDGDPARALVRPPAGLLGGVVVHGGDTAALVEQAAALLGDPARRGEIGARARAHVEEHHAAEGWSRALSAVVAAAREHRGEAAPPAGPDGGGPTDAEALLELLYASDHASFTPYHAYTWLAGELPPERRPAGHDDVRARVDEILAAPLAADRRAVVAPPVEPGAISALVADLRRRVAAGEVRSGVVVVSPEELDRAVALLERALAEGVDVDLDLVAGERVEDVARPGDLVLAAG